jgi:hypothetical protein
VHPDELAVLFHVSDQQELGIALQSVLLMQNMLFDGPEPSGKLDVSIGGQTLVPENDDRALVDDFTNLLECFIVDRPREIYVDDLCAYGRRVA